MKKILLFIVLLSMCVISSCTKEMYMIKYSFRVDDSELSPEVKIEEGDRIDFYMDIWSLECLDYIDYIHYPLDGGSKEGIERYYPKGYFNYDKFHLEYHNGAWELFDDYNDKYRTKEWSVNDGYIKISIPDKKCKIQIMVEYNEPYWPSKKSITEYYDFKRKDTEIVFKIPF